MVPPILVERPEEPMGEREMERAEGPFARGQEPTEQVGVPERVVQDAGNALRGVPEEAELELYLAEERLHRLERAADVSHADRCEGPGERLEIAALFDEEIASDEARETEGLL